MSAATESKSAASPSPKKSTAGKAPQKKPAMKAAHPPTSEMVNSAISELKERKGASLPAIKKYIGSHYTVDLDRQAPFIKKYLKSAVEKNIIIQTKGTGANGRFKLAGKPEKAKKERPEGEKKAKPAAAAPTTTPTKKTKVAKEKKSPSVAKKSGKAPAAKTKSPKPRKTPPKSPKAKSAK